MESNISNISIINTRSFLDGIRTTETESFQTSLSPDLGTIIWASINGILFVCILCGNTLTIIAIRTCRRLRSIISNLFILSLAVSDFMVGLTVPYHLSFYLGSNLGQSHGHCLLRFFLIIFTCCVSTCTLIAIAIDRYIAIVYALHYRRYMTRRMVLSIIAINWILGAAVAIIPMFWNHYETARDCEFNQVLPIWYMAGVVTPGFILIWTIMVLLYWRILREASRQARQLRNANNNSPTRHAIAQIDWKSAQIVVFIMGCFSICWFPYFIVACAELFYICEITPLLYKATLSLLLSNSALNPIIYAWKNTNFRRAFVRLLHCKNPNRGLCNEDLIQGSLNRPHNFSKQKSKEEIDTIEKGIVCQNTLSVIQLNNYAEDRSITTTINQHFSTILPIDDSISSCENDCAFCLACRIIVRKSSCTSNSITNNITNNNKSKDKVSKDIVNSSSTGSVDNKSENSSKGIYINCKENKVDSHT